MRFRGDAQARRAVMPITCGKAKDMSFYATRAFCHARSVTRLFQLRHFMRRATDIPVACAIYININIRC